MLSKITKDPSIICTLKFILTINSNVRFNSVEKKNGQKSQKDVRKQNLFYVILSNAIRFLSFQTFGFEKNQFHTVRACNLSSILSPPITNTQIQFYIHKFWDLLGGFKNNSDCISKITDVRANSTLNRSLFIILLISSSLFFFVSHSPFFVRLSCLKVHNISRLILIFLRIEPRWLHWNTSSS